MEGKMKRDNKGRFVKTLTEEETKKRQYENSKKWNLKNRERRREIEKKSKSRPEYKKRQAELKLKRYYEGLDDNARKKYENSNKGKLARIKARDVWKQRNPDKILEKDRRHRDELKDCYVIQKIIRGTELNAQDIRENPELIEAKRLIIKTKRLCKTLKN